MSHYEQYEIARLAVMDPRGRFLVVQRAFSAKRSAGFWEFPGGQVNPSEKRARPNHPEEYLARAALRECAEETGVYPMLLSGFYPYVNRELVDAPGHYTASIALGAVDRLALPLLSPEIAQATWLNLDTILQQIDEGCIFRADTTPLLQEITPVLAKVAQKHGPRSTYG